MIAQVITLPSQKTNLEEVELLASTLSKGTTYRGICPRCGGGQSKENSFAVSKSTSGSLYFKCFRAKCQWQGTLRGGVITAENITAPHHATRLMDRPVEALDENQVRWFREKFGISPDEHVYWVPSKDMYAFKILGPLGQHRGWQLRSFQPTSLIKCTNYNHRAEPFMHWFFPQKAEMGGVVVVEDYISARKVSLCGVAACCLNGTHIDFERAYEIAGYCEDFVVLALDRGTMPQMITYRQRYEPLFGSTEIWQLDLDLKYVSRKRIREALYDGKSDFISVS